MCFYSISFGLHSGHFSHSWPINKLTITMFTRNEFHYDMTFVLKRIPDGRPWKLCYSSFIKFHIELHNMNSNKAISHINGFIMLIIVLIFNQFKMCIWFPAAHFIPSIIRFIKAHKCIKQQMRFLNLAKLKLIPISSS